MKLNTPVVVVSKLGRVIGRGRFIGSVAGRNLVEQDGGVCSYDRFVDLVEDRQEHDREDQIDRQEPADDLPPLKDPSAMSVDELPDAVQAGMSSTNRLSDEAIDRVVGDIGRVAVDSLRGVGVREIDLLGLAASLQKACQEFLIREKSAKGDGDPEGSEDQQGDPND